MIEAAAVLHLDVGVAIAGISAASAQLFIDLGVQLIDGLIPPNPDVAKNLSLEKRDEITNVRATWHAVAGSAFLSVNDVFGAQAAAEQGAEDCAEVASAPDPAGHGRRD